jgi:hypothetical protein
LKPKPAGSLERDADDREIAVPLRPRTADTELSFISTLTTFGSAVDVTLSEHRVNR